MKILVLNGSPKGEYSITLQTLRYLAKHFPEHSFSELHAGQKIKALEKDFSPAVSAIEQADILIFSYPVYTFIAPCQLHRFIELLKASGMDLSGKFVSQVTTSKHFYDITAHRYIQDNCQDLGMKFVRGLSADMDDLLSEKGQQDALGFFRYLLWCVEQDHYEPLPQLHTPTLCKQVTPAATSDEEKPGDVIIVTDCRPEDLQLQSMIHRFRAKLPRKTRTFNVWDFPFNAGCLGCFKCAVSGKCVHKDRFDDHLRNEIQTAESIVYAFTIKDHSMGSRFKMYDDRNFCNGHRTVTIGMPVGYLISGNLSQETNLQTIIEARAQVGSNFLAGIATDEQDPDGQIDALADHICYSLENRYVPPQNFYGIGGMTIFRDLIWLMQGMMKADHKFYKSHGQYNFPQKKWPQMLKSYAIGALLSNPKLIAKMGNAMNEGMIAPYRKLLEKE